MKTITNRPSFQGDLMIQRIDKLPENVEKVEPEGQYYVLAHSETGHNHVMERTNVSLYRLPDEIYEAFLVVEEDKVVEHHRSFDTHEALGVPAGTYRIRRQREYTPEGYRRAAD